MWFSVLGPLSVQNGETEVRVPGSKLRVLLAALAVQANQALSCEELADSLWDASPPPALRPTVRGHVKRLRRVLGRPLSDRIITRHPGYLIQLGADELDLLKFASLYSNAATTIRARSWERATQLLTEALALWRGRALADIPSEALQRDEVPRLDHLRLQALEWRIEADLHLGRSGELVPQLRALTTEYPLREIFHAQLMLALYRGGRQTEALDHYRQVRGMLIRQVGLEPGREMQELQRRILRADPDIVPDGYTAAVGPTDLRIPAIVAPADTSRPAADAPAISSRPPIPHQLPAGVPDFTGRASELAVLSGFLDDAASTGNTTVMITAISGTAGVGKTALAVHWAHRVALHFPDGQLYVNLHGFGPPHSQVGSDEALQWLLEALGVPAPRIPRAPEARAALYRTMLDGRRVLVLIDNARDADQARPLVPGTRGSLVVVTSRNKLVSLVAAEGARLITLDLLSADEARRLLARRLGRHRAAAEPEAVTELIRLCGRLPLALAIAAAQAAARPGVPLAALTADLRDDHGRLDRLDAGDELTNVRSVFSWSYRQLDDAAARMFRLLGLHPGSDVTATAAASLVRRDQATTRRLLGQLAQTHLLAEPAPGRYAFHDLMRVFAAEQARASESAEQRRAAIRRMLDHYLHSARNADKLLHPARDPIAPGKPDPAAVADNPRDLADAMAWFDAERENLVAAVSLAADTGFDVHAWQITWTLANYLERRGYWKDWAATGRIAVAAASRLGDPHAQARAWSALGKACGRLGAYQDAHAYLSHALELFGETGDRIGAARTHQAISLMLDRRGSPGAALGHERVALALYREAGYRDGEASALNALGWLQAQMGYYLQTLDCCEQALKLLHELGNRRGEAAAWDSLGYAHHHQGQHAQALACYQQSLRLFREVGDLSSQAETLDHLGDTYLADGGRDAAWNAWRQGLVILDDLQHPDGDKIRGKLAELEVTGSQPTAG